MREDNKRKYDRTYDEILPFFVKRYPKQQLEIFHLVFKSSKAPLQLAVSVCWLLGWSASDAIVRRRTFLAYLALFYPKLNLLIKTEPNLSESTR